MMDTTEVAQLRSGSGKAGPIAGADSYLGSLVEKGLGYGPSNPPAIELFKKLPSLKV